MTTYRQFLVSNVSGGPAASLPLTGFSTSYWNNGSPITGAVVTVAELSNGWYNVSVDNEPAGYLNLQLKYVDPLFAVTPTAETWMSYNYDIDDVMGRLITATSSTSLPVLPSQRFTDVSMNTKDNDDIVEIIQVPPRFRPLTGWTNLTVQAFPQARTLAPSTAPLSGSYSVSVLNETDGTLNVVIGKTVINNLVPAGVGSIPIFADIQGNDPNGYRKTLVQMNITVTRDYNSNT
jgi:hypothetical protein